MGKEITRKGEGRCGECDLLRRCRHALAVGGPEWERDIEKAMAADAALVKEIDAAIGGG